MKPFLADHTTLLFCKIARFH